MAQAKFIPVTENKKEIMDICENTHAILVQNHNIKISNAEAYPTIVSVFLKEVVNKLKEMRHPNEDISINLFNIIEMGISQEIMEEDENDGNIVPYCIPGVVFKADVKNDADSELKESYIDDEE